MAASNKLGEELTNAFQTGFGTPTLIINGSPFLSQRSVEVLTLIVDLIKNKNTANLQCPANTLDTSKDYTATITTNKGDIVIDLLEKVAPVTVNSFISLAQNGWFKDNIFFVVRNEFVMTGDKTNTGMSGPGYAYKDEINSAYTFDKEGVVGMYNFGPGTNGSQFFILKAPLSALNGRYTIFRKCHSKEWMFSRRLPRMKPSDSPDKADKILSVSISHQIMQSPSAKIDWLSIGQLSLGVLSCLICFLLAAGLVFLGSSSGLFSNRPGLWMYQRYSCWPDCWQLWVY